ncbi:MAG: hypothetical protein Fur0022_42380 [Anaerolineales bacterium]
MKCPYCGTENAEDAQECSNCSADLASLPKGPPPAESLAPTMMTSSAEVAAMLAAARGETEAPSEPAEPTADYTAPTIMTSSAEVAAMLAAAQEEKMGEESAAPAWDMVETPVEVPMEEVPMGEVSMDMPEREPEELPLEEVPMGEVPMGDNSTYAPTMISAVPAEVAEVIAAAQAEKAVEEPAAPTYVGIPDPLGVTDSGQIPVPEPTPTPPTPSYSEPVGMSSPPAQPPISTPEAPKDNKRMWIIGGVTCLVLCCLCSLLAVVVNLIPVIMEAF